MITMDVIDLTNSFTLADHCELANIVIDLVDDSLNLTSDDVNVISESNLKSTSPKEEVSKTLANAQKQTKKKKCNRLGDCPICWEELGINSLASTKCGHVYCLKCLEKALEIEKKCPTCRRSLKGSSAYHPLYVGRK